MNILKNIRNKLDKFLDSLPDGSVIYALNIWAMLTLITLIRANWDPTVFEPVNQTFTVVSNGTQLELREMENVKSNIFTNELSILGLSPYELINSASYMGVEEYDGQIYVCHPEVCMDSQKDAGLGFNGHIFYLDEIYGYAGLEHELTLLSVDDCYGYVLPGETGYDFYTFFQYSDNTSTQYTYCNKYDVWKNYGVFFANISVDTTIKELVNMFGYPHTVDVYCMDDAPSYALVCFLYNGESTVQQITVALVEDPSTPNGYYVVEISNTLANKQENTNG